MANILDEIVAATRQRLEQSPPSQTALECAIDARPAPPDMVASLTRPGRRIVAEVKRRSPSAGTLATDVVPYRRAKTYEEAGAAAISVLTEPDYFGGSLQDLSDVADRLHIPCLRKDFIVDPIQLLEARASGASCVLLIAAVCSESKLRALREGAEALSMHALVEAHTADEIRLAADSGARIIGVNSRNLKDFSIDLARAEALRPLITEAIPVAESGIEHTDDIVRMEQAGYRAFLIGSALMRAEDPQLKLAELIGSI